ncbi:TraB/GumN family protein [Flavitalea antarctica]
MKRNTLAEKRRERGYSNHEKMFPVSYGIWVIKIILIANPADRSKFQKPYLFLTMAISLRVLSSLLCLAFISASAQQSTPKTLLWRISGHGLQKPSYLFGTMHLSDKRLFRFSDSVYAAIEKSEGLAIEVNPDEMAVYYVNKMFDDLANKKKLQDLLSEEEFEYYREGLGRKFKKPAGEITTDEIVQERNRWMNDFMSKGEMPTFVDAYLYNIARRQGKWLGGIEDLGDQVGLMEDMVDKSDLDYLLLDNKKKINKTGKSMMESMIETYTREDLDGINQISNQGGAEYKDQLLLRRNVKMARRIDSLVNIRTMFLAIGAAHLPGDSGVIDLLTRRGFKVEPVMSAKKIDASKYSFKEVHLPWQEVSDVNNLYKISMPGNPASVRLQSLVDMKFHLDLFTMSTYATMAVIYPQQNFNKDSVAQQMASLMFKGRKLRPGRRISVGKATGQEYIERVSNQNMRVQILMDERVVYVAMMSGNKSEHLAGADANKFFSSFSIPENRVIPSRASRFLFTDTIMGITFEAPSRIEPNKQYSRDDNGWHISGFAGVDLDKGIYTMLFSQEVLPGHFIESDSLIEAELYEKMGTQYRVIDSQGVWLDGKRMLQVTGVSTQQKGLYARTVAGINGNRNILLMMIGDSANVYGEAGNSLFQSLRFIKQPGAHWKRYEESDKNFSTWAPAVFRLTGQELNNLQWLAYDTMTSTSYTVLPDTLGAYDWAQSDPDFWKMQIDAQLAGGELLTDKEVFNAGSKGRELLMRKKGGGSIVYRVRILLNGDKVYKLCVTGIREFVYQPDINRFFDEFTFGSIAADQALHLVPKANALIRDLAAVDSTTRLKAYQKLETAPFVASDLELLHGAVFKTYRYPYGTDSGMTVNNRIAERIVAFNKPESIDYFARTYNVLHNQDHKVLVLKSLAEMKSSESYKAMIALIKQSSLTMDPGYQLSEPLQDSLSLTAAFYPELRRFIKDTVFGPVMSSVALRLLDSNVIAKNEIIKDESDFIATARFLNRPVMYSEMNADYRLYDVAALLGRFNTGKSNRELSGLLTTKDKYLSRDVVELLLKNAQVVDAGHINKLAADKEIRVSVYEMLKTLGKQSLFPSKYLNQAAFAESLAYNSGVDDYSPSSLKFIEKRREIINGKSLNFYLYKMGFGEDEEFYLAMAGGYDSADSLEPAVQLTNIYWNAAFDQKKVKEQFKEMIRDRDEQ